MCNLRAKAWMSLLLLCTTVVAANELFSGTFLKKKEKITGTFTIKKVGDRTLLELSDDFKTRSGPDLQIVFSPKSFEKVNGKNAMEDAVSIALLKSNKGRQTFEIPADLNLAKMRCILIHCVKYTRLWGGAPLE